MEFKKAQKHEIKMKISIAAPAGFGKTYSSLLMAYGITGNWSTIGLIDTENAASLYSDIGEFNVLELNAPHSPERFCDAIDVAIESGIECLVIDQISSEWNFIIEAKDQLGGGFGDWGKVMPRHSKFIEKIQNAPLHIICNMRKKAEYAIYKEDGKNKVEKIGMKPVQKDGIEHEFSLCFDIINANHFAEAVKDRTGIFDSRTAFLINEDTGKELLDWSKAGTSRIDTAIEFITGADKTLLTKIYLEYPDLHKVPKFMKAMRKQKEVVLKKEAEEAKKQKENSNTEKQA